MPFVYSIVGTTPATDYATHVTPGTEDPTVVIRQAVRGVDLQGIYCNGRGVSLTAITGISVIVRRWTTVGSGGQAITPAPRRVGTTASTTAADKVAAITAGTVTGGFQLGFGFGAAGPGGWVARDGDSAIHLEGTAADELDINTVCGVTVMKHYMTCEIAE